eukprot:1136351-Prymnesium_polylepis.1
MATDVALGALDKNVGCSATRVARGAFERRRWIVGHRRQASAAMRSKICLKGSTCQRLDGRRRPSQLARPQAAPEAASALACPTSFWI